MSFKIETGEPSKLELALSKEIRAEIGRNEYSHRELSSLLNISVASIGRKLNGQTKWTVGELAKMSTAFNLPVSTLFRRAEEASDVSS